MKLDAKKLRTLLKSRGLTNTRLADLSGISRQAVQAMLKEDRVVEVRDRTVKGLAHALRLADESLLSPDPLSGYKQAVADAYAYLTFRGLGLPTTEQRSIDELYVPIRVKRIPESEEFRDCDPATDETETTPVSRAIEPIQEQDSLSFDDCLRLHRRILIKGEPGSGKTTTLRFAAWSYAQGTGLGDGGQRRPRLPILVRLADFARARESNSKLTLVQYVVARILRQCAPEYSAQVERSIELQLAEGACLVLLDGLDELGSEIKNTMGILRDFILRHDDNQFILTSRIVGLDSGPWKKLDFETFEITPWREEEVRTFIGRWYAGPQATGRKQSKKRADERIEELTSAIVKNPPILEIASNPLMLTILAKLHDARAALPRRRAELYAKIAEVRIDDWETSKRDARPGDALHAVLLEGREFGWLLGYMALAMQREGRVLRPRWWVDDVVQRFLRELLALNGEPAKEETERIIRYLCERTGLLVERGDGIFGFSHRTFQEYFAAQGLLTEFDSGGDMAALLGPFIFHPQWEEVVVHIAASLPVPRATALLRLILDDNDPSGRFLRRGQRLAMRCLAEGAAVADNGVIDQIFSEGDLIGSSGWLGITLRFIRVLKQFVARHKREAEQMLDAIENAAREKLSDEDYVVVYSSLHDMPKGPTQDPPGTIFSIDLGGRAVEALWPALPNNAKELKAWNDRVTKLVRNSKTETKRRVSLISLLGDKSGLPEAVQRALKELSVRDRLPRIRAACVEALDDAVSTNPSIAEFILERLDKEKSDIVLERLGRALRSVAPKRPEVRLRLEELFASGPERVRAGAARGLSLINFDLPDHRLLLERFMATAASYAEPSQVRCAAIWTTASVIGQDDDSEVDQLVEKCLDDQDQAVRETALHVLADALADGRKQWSPKLVDRIEKMLMAIPDPCPRLFSDLMLIVGLKEMHGGRRLKQVVEDTLDQFGDQIGIAFIFGSVARLEQIRASDIDLMIIGKVRLKELALALQLPERVLGRTINPAIYLPEKFREQYREGNPFLLDVVRRDKVFVKGSNDELARLVADGSSD